MTLEKQYQPLAIKYRPKKFADLMGQEVLVETLSSAIINARLANAYLLTGIRGVGKTTSARLIAGAINCENPTIQDQAIEACGVCANCKAFSSANHPDIIEIDAASRTSVDDIRSIIESSEYRPLLGKYKVFIIDEVHMISKNAFNALLKTLEEPPAKVKFIFATTEVNKIPITIISRCQRFDLKRLGSEDITSLLSKIASNENIQCEESAMQLIAAKSEGSGRDAVSMLDQASLLSAGKNTNEISAALVMDMLAITSIDAVISFASNVIKQELEHALSVIMRLHKNGNDIIFFVENLLDIICYLTKLSLIKGYKEDVYAPYQEILSSIHADSNVEVLTVIWQIFSKGVVELKHSHNQRLALEMLTIKSIYAAGLPTIREAMESLEKPRLPRQ